MTSLFQTVFTYTSYRNEYQRIKRWRAVGQSDLHKGKQTFISWFQSIIPSQYELHCLLFYPLKSLGNR